MRPLPFSIAFAVVVLAGPVLAAEPAVPADEPVVQDRAKDPAKDAQASPDKAAVPADAQAESETPRPGKSAADKSTPQRFVPSEQVRADFDVSFPIDM